MHMQNRADTIMAGYPYPSCLKRGNGNGDGNDGKARQWQRWQGKTMAGDILIVISVESR